VGAVEELRVVLSALASDNQRLKTELEQRETVIRLLTENLAIARRRASCFRINGATRNFERRRSA